MWPLPSLILTKVGALAWVRDCRAGAKGMGPWAGASGAGAARSSQRGLGHWEAGGAGAAGSNRWG